MCMAPWILERVMMSVLMPGLGVHGLMGIATDIMVLYRLSVSRCQATRLAAGPAKAMTCVVSY